TDVIDPYYNTTHYEYDEANRRKKMTISKTGNEYEYSYDNANQMQAVWDNYGTYTFQYDAFGRMSKKTLPNGTWTELQSNHLGNLLSLINYKSNNSVISQYLSQNAGDFDMIGNRKKVLTHDGNYEYNYDSIYQLTEAKLNGNLTEGYSYDSVGNRIVGAYRDTPSGNYVYDNGNRLETLTHDTMTVSYTYDNNGSRITKTDTTGVTNYTYDYENRLKRIDFANGDYAEYTYDALGRRIEKKVFNTQNSSLTTHRYVYDGEDIIAVLDSTNTAIASITHGPGIDHPLSYHDLVADSTYYYHQDYLGSITAITDSNQNVIETYRYDSYGNLLTSLNASTLQLIYAFTGRELDPQSGLYFYRARYYDSKVGRFLEPDPIGFLAGVNFYVYCNNSPVNWIDPLGLAVGDWWDYKSNIEFIAKTTAVEAYNEAKRSGLPGAAGGPQDAYRHALWNQKMKEGSSPLNALVASTYHELVDNVKDGTQTWEDLLMDMHNNLKGALSDKDALDLLKDGELRINKIDPQKGYKNYKSKCK
ncbi:MAG: RHS repeat-associated core domain-containing protein, partial [bacterium]